jgi:hypothetical protein
MSLVKELSRVRVSRFYAPGPTNLASVGLAPPVWRIAVGRAVAAECPEGRDPPPAPPEGAPIRLLIGNPVEEDGGLLYARRSGWEDVTCAVGGPFRALLTDALAEPLGYRNRTMLSVLPEHVRRIELSLNGESQAVVRGEDGQWTVEEEDDRDARAPDGEAIQDVLFFVSNLRALRAEEHQPADLDGYGLERPAVSLTLGLSGGDGIRKTLLFGNRAEQGGRFAMVQGQDVVFVMGDGVSERLTRGVVSGE